MQQLIITHITHVQLIIFSMEFSTVVQLLCTTLTSNIGCMKVWSLHLITPHTIGTAETLTLNC